MSVSLWAEIVKDHDEVIISGGEPLLYPEIEDLLLILNEMGIPFTLLTNFSMWKTGYAKYFKASGILSISIHEKTANDEKFMSRLSMLVDYECNFELSYIDGTCLNFIRQLKDEIKEKLGYDVEKRKLKKEWEGVRIMPNGNCL
jgi:organic radical activating enzyme